MTLEHRPDEPSSVRLAGTLGVAGLISGLAIVVVFETTAPIIAANKAAALERAVLNVVPGATKMQRLVHTESGPLAPAPAQPAPDAQVVYAAYDDGGAFKGFALVGEGAGFQDTIRLIYGYQPADKKIVGMEVLDSRETPGLGDKIYKDPAFAASFRQLSVEPKVVLVKAGGDERPNVVDGITGATISSRAVVEIINATNAVWLSRLPPPDAVPALEPSVPAETKP